MVDGMRLNLLEGQGQFSGIYLNDGMAQEISYDTGSQSAEVAQGGLRVNMIPREGGNTFSGIFFIQGANGPLASDNRSDEVKAFIPQPLGLAYTYEINPSFGGPIKRDKAWFYFTYKLQDTKSYTTLPDRSQGTQQNWPNYSYVTRVTWQATSRDKIRFYFDKQMNGQRLRRPWRRPTTIEASHQTVDAERPDAAAQVDAGHDQPADARGRHHVVRPQFPPRAAARCRRRSTCRDSRSPPASARAPTPARWTAGARTTRRLRRRPT